MSTEKKTKSIWKNIGIYLNKLKRKLNTKYEYHFEDSYKLLLTRQGDLIFINRKGDELPIHGVRYIVKEETLNCINNNGDSCHHIRITKGIHNLNGVDGAVLWLEDVRNPSRAAEGVGGLNLMPQTPEEYQLYNIVSKEILRRYGDVFKRLDPTIR